MATSSVTLNKFIPQLKKLEYGASFFWWCNNNLKVLTQLEPIIYVIQKYKLRQISYEIANRLCFDFISHPSTSSVVKLAWQLSHSPINIILRNKTPSGEITHCGCINKEQLRTLFRFIIFSPGNIIADYYSRWPITYYTASIPDLEFFISPPTVSMLLGCSYAEYLFVSKSWLESDKISKCFLSRINEMTAILKSMQFNPAPFYVSPHNTFYNSYGATTNLLIEFRFISVFQIEEAPNLNIKDEQLSKKSDD